MSINRRYNLMKNFKKIVSSLLCGAVLTLSLAAPVSAKTFPDVESDATVSWAKSAINSMTDSGYIKGYEDGSFKPQQAISKVEALLLMSRIMGVNESDYEMSLEWALDEYEATVAAINTQYPEELSYLMYLNVLNVNDLRNYASSANANTSLQRWQAAYLMCKLTGRDADAKKTILSESEYSDYDKIPEEARPYVAYATNAELMNGMGNDENGKSYFSPETTLTRAQMAVLLDRVIKLLDRSASIGIVDSIDYDKGEIVISTSDGGTEEFEADENTVIKFDGKDAYIDDIDKGDEVMITYTMDSPRLIEAIPGQSVQTVFGIIGSLSGNGGRQQIMIKDAEDNSKNATYTVASDCSYTVKGTKASFNDLKVGNNVELIISGEKVTSVVVTEKETTASGIFDSIATDDAGSSYIVLYNKSTGKTAEYALSTGNISVRRNGTISNLRDLSPDDEITLALTNGKVTSVTAKSETSELTGTIKEIVLSEKPEITLEINGKTQTYYMSTATKVTVNNVDGTIYDLRPGNAASVVVDGSTLAKIDSSATATYGRTTVSGKVQSINSTLKVISVLNASGATDTVYYDGSTNFLKASDGKGATAKDITAGSNISATGSDSTGYFVATIIIID